MLLVMVVNGYGSREDANNNHTRVECPHIPCNDSVNNDTQSEVSI